MPAFPSSWAHTDDIREIYLEVRAPYWLPHLITIWCAHMDGELFIGARDPETKHWPGWVDKEPAVRFKVGTKVYNGMLVPVSDEHRISLLREAYIEKYNLPRAEPGQARPFRYWSVEAG